MTVQGKAALVDQYADAQVALSFKPFHKITPVIFAGKNKNNIVFCQHGGIDDALSYDDTKIINFCLEIKGKVF